MRLTEMIIKVDMYATFVISIEKARNNENCIPTDQSEQPPL